MAVTTAPLLSFGASGQVAKTLVSATWKGRPYMRRYVIPSNPNTTAQQTQRGQFRWANEVYKRAPALVTDTFDLYAQGQVMTGRNGFLKVNLSALYGQANLDLLTFCPGAKGGLPATQMTVTPTDATLTVALTAPALPPGWTIAQAEAACILGQDPATGTNYTIVSGSDNSDPYSIALAGLTNASEYQVCGWFKFNKPDASIAYGPALLAQATPAP